MSQEHYKREETKEYSSVQAIEDTSVSDEDNVNQRVTYNAMVTIC